MKYSVLLNTIMEKLQIPVDTFILNSIPPSPDKLGARCSATPLIKLLCFSCVEFYHVMGNMFHIQWQNSAVSKQEEQKFSHNFFFCSSIDTCAFEYAGHWLFEQS